MRCNYSSGPVMASYCLVTLLFYSQTVAMVNGAAYYDPSLPAGVDKPFLRERCLAVVEELDYEPAMDHAGNAKTDDQHHEGDSWLYCETPGGYFYKVPTTDPDWIENMVQGGSLVSGVTELNLPADTLVNEHLGTLEWNRDEMVAPGLVQVDDDYYYGMIGSNHTHSRRRRRRRLAQVTGTKTVLAVRVTALDQQNTFDEATLRNEVFGTDNTNLRTQYDKCSFGQLKFVPTANRQGETAGVAIVGGVVTVTVNHLATEGDSVLRNAVTLKLKQEFGVSNPDQLADHVMYCLPSRAMTGIAYAYINSWLSVYKDVWGLYVSAQMHELGHNLNLAHATDFKFLSHDRARSEYDDKTGLMGYSYNHKEFPKMCFNPAKSWQLKWYGNKEVSYLPTCDVVTMKVGGIVDYQSSEVETVLLQFNQLDENKDYYLTYNARTLFNRETQEGGNKVVIDAQGGNGRSYSRSTLEARLEVGESFAMPNFNGVTGDSVTVRFDERGGFSNREATITIRWIPNDTSVCRTDAPTQRVTLNPTSALTGSPTDFPTSAPSPLPTSGPSGSPTVKPTVEPTMTPTVEPTQIPTESPTDFPTSAPSPLPTSGPSGSPTASPNGEPTSNPTPAPSKSPSANPTLTPSAAPTPNPTVGPSVRPTRMPSSSPTKNPTLFPTVTASDNPTIDPTKRPTSSPTKSPTLEPTTSPSKLPTLGPTSRPPTRAPSTPPTIMPTTTRTSAPSENPSLGPTSSPTPMETDSPSKDPTLTPTMLPSEGPTFLPTVSPSASPTMDPTLTPTILPSERPTFLPTVSPSASPTMDPTLTPTILPSERPTFLPTVSPSASPTMDPTARPTVMPSKRPSVTPTVTPSTFPTMFPTSRPTLVPSEEPTGSPTVSPTEVPTPLPSPKPSLDPSSEPTATPSMTPSSNPSRQPTGTPSSNPTFQPSSLPSPDPTPVPTLRPTVLPPVNPACQRWYWFMFPECKGQGMDPSV